VFAFLSLNLNALLLHDVYAGTNLTNNPVISPLRLLLTAIGSRNICGYPLGPNEFTQANLQNQNVTCVFTEPLLRTINGRIRNLASSQNMNCLQDSEGFKCWGQDLPDESLLSKLNTLSVDSSINHTNVSTKLFAGGQNICVQTQDHRVVCANANAPQLSNFGPYANLIVSSISPYYFCAIDGKFLKCENLDKMRAPLLIPTAPFEKPTELSVSLDFACVIDDSGLACFGDKGELTGFNKSEFRDARGLVSGSSHLCAITRDDRVACALVTDFDSINHEAASRVPDTLARPGAGVLQLSAGDSHTCALLTSGKVQCWGDSNWGVISPPQFGAPVVYITSGRTHACAVTSAGQVKCWGEKNTSMTQPPLLPISPMKIAIAEENACAWNESGINCEGLVVGFGVNSLPEFLHPKSVALAASGIFSICGIDKLSSGNNSRNSLLSIGAHLICNDQDATSLTPQTPPATLTNPTTIALGINTACAVANDELMCWGSEILPGAPEKVHGIQKLQIGISHACLLDHFGLECWGDPASEASKVPPALKDIGAVTDFAVGYLHTCALTADRKVKCWGKNDQGQTDPPVLIEPVSIAASANFTCATDRDGIKCWGDVNIKDGQSSALRLRRKKKFILKNSNR
jgi:hypothetical protein